MASGTLTQTTAHRGDLISGTYAAFTPTSCSIAGQNITGFSAAAGAWSGNVYVNQALGVQDVQITDGSTPVDLGNITILATPSNKLGLGISLGL